MQPFSKRARPWEISARELRTVGHVRENQILDPFALAPKVGLCLMDFDEIPIDGELRNYLLNIADGHWSGGVFPIPLPDATYLCILNPQHDIKRKRITLMEEVAHIFLKHNPTGIRKVSEGLLLRDYDKAQEAEAYGVGAAALLPWASFFMDVNKGMSVQELATKYQVSVALVSYRISITGATNVFKARQKNHRSS